jgi:hypothetical protein
MGYASCWPCVENLRGSTSSTITSSKWACFGCNWRRVNEVCIPYTWRCHFTKQLLCVAWYLRWIKHLMRIMFSYRARRHTWTKHSWIKPVVLIPNTRVLAHGKCVVEEYQPMLLWELVKLKPFCAITLARHLLGVGCGELLDVTLALGVS